MAAAVFASCTDFFSTSLASWASRHPDKLIPTVTPDNVEELITTAENNPDLSLSLLKKIQDAADEAYGDDKQKLQNAALEVAVNAAGVGHAVLAAAGELTTIGDAEHAKILVKDSLDDMENLEEASSILFDILPAPNTQEFDDFVAFADPNDLALAAALLIAGEAKKDGDFDKHINDIGHDTPRSEPEKLAVEMAKAAMAREDELSESIRDVLKGLNLISG